MLVFVRVFYCCVCVALCVCAARFLIAAVAISSVRLCMLGKLIGYVSGFVGR